MNNSTSPVDRREPVAIIGMGLRFPGGNNSPGEFSEFLANGRSAIGPIPEGRLGAGVDATEVGFTNGGYLDEIEQFDAMYFNVSPREADFIDPQQRLVLETAWEALEDANIDPATL